MQGRSATGLRAGTDFLPEKGEGNLPAQEDTFLYGVRRRLMRND